MKNIIIAILVALVLILGFLFFSQKKSPVSYEPWPETEPATVKPTMPKPNPTPASQTTPPAANSTTSEYKNNQIGFSIDYPKNIGQASLQVSNGDKGKMIVGRICDEGTQFCMFIGGTTPVIQFPGELNANEVSSYPTSTELKKLFDRGYRNETKINSKGEEYVLIYGQKEVDMPYIGEGQIVAIFKLKSSVDFKALGFMLVGGSTDTFLSIMDSVDIY